LTAAAHRVPPSMRTGAMPSPRPRRMSSSRTQAARTASEIVSAGTSARRHSNGNGVQRGRVTDMQRARLLAACGEAACDLGWSNVTVADIVSRAGVSRRTFYEIFVDSEACLLCTLQDALEHAQKRVRPAWDSSGSWLERLRRSLIELLCLFDEDQVLARLLVVESLVAGRPALEQRANAIDALVDAVKEGAEDGQGRGAPTRMAAEGAVGGVLGILHSRLSQGETSRLIELAGPLMSMLVLPYRGIAGARRELERPVVVPDSHREDHGAVSLGFDPIRDAGMRLTYRTMRVLGAIAQRPDSSNRRIGDLADMNDQGQVSKLLGRL
jgi:AcrR family transcriptional regulator